MLKKPMRVPRTLTVLAVVAITHCASADILFASAEFGPPNGFDQLSGASQEMRGARFTLTGEAQITGIGGVVLSIGDIFTAIVPLPSPTGLPTGSVEEVALAHAVFAPDTSGDIIVPVDVVLPAGDYAIIVGAGAFGATGSSAAVVFGNVPFADVSFVSGNQFGWLDQPLSEYRFLVEGFLLDDLDGDGLGVDFDNCVNNANPDQTDTDGDGFGNACDSDLNNDCVVNVQDLGLLRAAFFTDDANVDLNNDGVVNVVDLGILRSRFFAPPGPSGASNICDFPVTLDGEFEWVRSFSIDLDAGVLGSDSDPGYDILFDQTTSFQSALRPLNGASIARMGAAEPSVQDCIDATMSPNTLLLADANIGDWLCARTNDGQLSRVRIDDADMSDLDMASAVDISLASFNCHVCEQAYDPTPLPNLLGWYDANFAESIQFLSGGQVIRWRDRSGNLDPLGSRSGTEQPQVTDAGINGLGSFIFDGFDDRMCSNTPVSLRPGYSVFVVAQNDVRQNYNGLLSLRDNGFVIEHAALEFYWQVGTTDTGSGNLVVGANRELGPVTGLLVRNPPPAVTQTYVAAAGVALGNTAPGFMRVNGISYTPELLGTPDTPIETRELCVGFGFGELVEGNSLNGSIGEVMVFDRRLSDTEVEFVETYLMQKWLAQ